MPKDDKVEVKQKLTMRDLDVLARQALGTPTAEILSDMNLTRDAFSSIVSKPAYKEKLAALRARKEESIEQMVDDANRYVSLHAKEAAIRNVDMMRNCPDHNARQRSIFDILNRATVGAKPSQGGNSGGKVQVGVQILFSESLKKGNPDLINVISRMIDSEEESIPIDQNRDDPENI
jgi:hypothetical protein